MTNFSDIFEEDGNAYAELARAPLVLVWAGTRLIPPQELAADRPTSRQEPLAIWLWNNTDGFVVVLFADRFALDQYLLSWFSLV